MLGFFAPLFILVGVGAFCDNLVPEYCMLPFPNDYFRVSRPDGGFRLNFSNNTFPVDDNGKVIDAEKGQWNDLHGFSVFPGITAYFKGMVESDLENVARWWNINSSLEDSSPTILLDAKTLQKIPHWVELDHSSEKAELSGKHAFMMWPVTALDFERRYIVAIKTVGKHGPLASSENFKALKNGTYTDNSRQLHFNDIFTQLESIGVKRQSLLLAWDFTTNDKQDVTSRMITVRDDAAMKLGREGPVYNITSIEYNTSALVDKKIKGQFRMPLYLTTALPIPHARLNMDEHGRPFSKGFAWFDFEVIIPKGFSNLSGSLGILQYGHGLFGSFEEVEKDHPEYLYQDATDFAYVICSSTWLGLSHDDEPAAAEIIGKDLTDFAYIPERLTQGVVNAHGLLQMMRGRFMRDPLVTTPSGQSIIDPSKTAYFGNSCGGIMGTVYMATTTVVKRGLLGVPGGPFGLLLPRSTDFGAEFNMLKYRYSDPVDRINLFQILQMLWDRSEPAGYIRSVNEQLLAGTPQHEVIVHYGLGDSQVSWLGAHAIGRAVGAVMYASNAQEHNETFFGFEMLADDVAVQGRSGIVGWDYKSPQAPVGNLPPAAEGDTHQDPRRDSRSQAQMGHFFLTGQIVNTCKGTCVSDTRPSKE